METLRLIVSVLVVITVVLLFSYMYKLLVAVFESVGMPWIVDWGTVTNYMVYLFGSLLVGVMLYIIVVWLPRRISGEEE